MTTTVEPSVTAGSGPYDEAVLREVARRIVIISPDATSVKYD